MASFGDNTTRSTGIMTLATLQLKWVEGARMIQSFGVPPPPQYQQKLAELGIQRAICFR